MRFVLPLLLFTSLVSAAYEVQPYSTADSMQISSSGSYTLYGSTTIVSPGVSSGGGYSLNTGFFHPETGCTVKFNDLENFALAWLLSGTSSADLNSDSSVNALDFAIFARYWLSDCPPGWPLK
jgi:hypothetical protein